MNTTFSIEDMKKAFEAGREVYYDDNDGRTTISKQVVEDAFERFIDKLNKDKFPPTLPATISELTDLENTVLDYICRELATWRYDEPGYSCIGGDDVTRKFKWSGKKTSGIISSLFKKDYLYDGYGDRVTLNVNWNKIPVNFGREEEK